MGLKTTRSAVAAGVAAVAAVGALGGGMALAAGPHAAKSVTIGVKQTPLGSVLYAGPKKLTVYEFTKDHGTKSACDKSAGCAAVWPAVKATGMPKAGKGVKASLLGTAKEGKFEQVTYHGHLLYYFKSDKGAMSVAGQGVESSWFALNAKGAKITKKAPSTTSTSTTSTSSSTTPTKTTSGGGAGGGWE